MAGPAIAVLVALLAAPAWATFPGRNGELVVTHGSNFKYLAPVFSLWMERPRSGTAYTVPMCRMGYEYPDPPTCDGAGPPAVSPDGARVAYFAAEARFATDPRAARASLRVLSLADEHQTRAEVPMIPDLEGPVDTGGPIYSSAVWTPDGDHLLAERPLDPGSPDGRRGVFALRLDGVEQGAVVTDAEAPDVSSRGDLAFVRAGDIYVMEVDREIRRLTFRGGAEPSLSPGGRWIAFSRGSHVYVTSLEGRHTRRVTNGHTPVWSPDGRRIALIRDRIRRGITSTHVFVLTRRTGAIRHLLRQDDWDENWYGLEWRALPR